MKGYSLSLVILFFLYTINSSGQPANQWDSIKATIAPVVAPAFVNDYEPPFCQPLAAYGWEDGIHISRDGLNLYALYYPGDLYSWTVFFLDNINSLPICDLLGITDYLRPYSQSFGMDMSTNTVGCDSFVNIDILYAERTSINDSFLQWQLSDIARPGAPEGGAYTLQSESVPGYLDFFIFTVTSDIWMIRNTANNPSGIASAVRLPSPVNPVTDEFSADNPHMERLADDTLLLVYEKFTDINQRNFVWSYSYDNGYTWTYPVAMTTISPSLGHIEHPHLYKNPLGEWYIYFSIDCEIYRAKQGIEGNWDSWQNIELVIAKGNSPCIGEPSLTASGDISFAVAYSNISNNDTTDKYDLDPWFLPKINDNNVPIKNIKPKASIFPNPFNDKFKIVSNNEIEKVIIYNLFGEIVYVNHIYEKEAEILINNISSGMYFVEIYTKLGKIRYKITKH